MPRVRDVLCAGGCGNLVWRGTGCLPPGEATCQPCRRSRKSVGAPATCSICGQGFASRRMGNGRMKATCSPGCAHVARFVRRGPCVDCGTAVTGTGRPLLCRSCADGRRRTRQRRHDSMRRGAKPVREYPLTLAALGRRDCWRCHLCGRRVDRRLRFPHRMAPTFDHLIPCSEAGPDSPENLRLAHLSCNSSRGDGGEVQLLLFG